MGPQSDYFARPRGMLTAGPTLRFVE